MMAPRVPCECVDDRQTRVINNGRTLTKNEGGEPAHADSPPFRCYASAAPTRRATPLAHIAAPRGPHLRAAGHAERRVDGGAGDLLQELGGGVGLGRGGLLELDLDRGVLGAGGQGG